MTRLEVAAGQSMVMRSPVHESPAGDDGAAPAGGSAPGIAAADRATDGESEVPEAGSGAEGSSSASSSPAGRGTSTDGAGRRKPGPPQGILPDKAAEDLDLAWGGSTGNPERDQWLKEQRPPHWD